MMNIRNAPNVLSAIALTAVFSAQAAPVGGLTTFQAGTPAKATDVNGNFTTIVNTVNTNDTRLTTVENNKQNIVSGTCPAGSAIRAIAANGTVTCQNAGGSVGYASVNAVAGIPEFAGTQTQLGFATGPGSTAVIGRYMASPASSDVLLAPISIPHGATITAFSFTCLQNTASINCNGSLFRDDFTSLASVSIAAQSSVAQTASTTTISTTPANAAVVDNQNFGYFVVMTINGANTSNILPVRATVTYSLP